MPPALPPRQVTASTEATALGRLVADSPKLALTLIGAGIGGLWGGLAGVVLGSWRLGAALGGAAMGLKGYSHGKDLEAWLQESQESK